MRSKKSPARKPSGSAKPSCSVIIHFVRGGAARV
jgi:hypothetical protein